MTNDVLLDIDVAVDHGDHELFGSGSEKSDTSVGHQLHGAVGSRMR